MKSLMLMILVLLQAAAVPVVGGTWRGNVSVTEPDGTVRNAPAMAVFKQAGTQITGWAGDNETDQNPILKGTLTENKLTFMVERRNGVTFTVTLTLKDGKLTGTAKSSGGPEFPFQLTKSQR